MEAQIMEKERFELLEWHDRRYQHRKFFKGTREEAEEAQRQLNRGYTGPRFLIKRVKA